MSWTSGSGAFPRVSREAWRRRIGALVRPITSRSASGVRRAVGWAACAAVLLTVAPSLGQDAPPRPEDEALAQSLFDAGRALMAEGDTSKACEKFEASNRIAPSAGTSLNLGKCLESSGRTASAWAAYKRAIGLARATGQTRHVSAGEAFVAEIEPRLSRLRVEATDPPPGLTVRRGGATLGSAALGVPLAVDPGPHAIEAQAPGRRPWTTTVVVEPGSAEVVVVIPVLAPADAVAPPPPPPPRDDERDTLRLAGIVVGGAGLAIVVVGAAFGAMTLADATAAEEDASLCPDRRCTPAGEAAIADAEAKAWVSNVALGLGAAAMVTGGVLVVLSLADESPAAAPQALRWAPWATTSAAGVVVGCAL